MTEQQHPSTSTLEEIGAELTKTRAERDLSVADISATLRLTPAHIEALERGDIDALPAATYAVGYLRSYANHLGLDANDLCHRLHQSLSDEQVRPEYTFVADQFPRRSGAGRMALAGLVVLVVGSGGWYAIDTNLLDPGVEPVSEETVETVLSETPAIDDDEVGFGPLQSGNGTEVATVSPSGVDGDALEQGIVGPQPADPLQQGLAGTDGAGEGNGIPASPSADPLSGGEELAPRLGQAVAHNRNPNEELVIKALATSWVEISRPDGSIVSAWLMREGDEYIVPGDQDIYLTTGNAGGLEIEIVGSDPWKLGEWGETVSELPLDPTLLKDRY